MTWYINITFAWSLFLHFSIPDRVSAFLLKKIYLFIYPEVFFFQALFFQIQKKKITWINFKIDKRIQIQKVDMEQLEKRVIYLCLISVHINITLLGMSV